MRVEVYIVSVYTMMVTFMIGAMSGLVLWSSWASSRHGIINTALSHYDYIIVGGGTAGCVLAARLSADPKHSVLLVEAGDHFNWLSTIPLATPILQGSAQDWAYSTKPQLHSSWGLLNQSSAWPRGRGLGGSGQLNYLLHYGGSEEDFARWEKSGAAGWGFAQLKPYLSRMLGFERNCTSRMQHCANSYRNLLLSAAHRTCIQSQRGCSTIQVKPSMHVTQVDPEVSVLGQAFVKAGIELADTFKGIKFSTAQSTVFKGQRWSSLDGYLRPSLGHPNLHVLLNSQVSKVMIDRNRKVQGVELRGRGDHSIIRSNREVILSAGAINTPHILLQSGIGPNDELRKHGIPVVSDLHVGCNLHDHLNMPLYVSLEAPVSVTLDKVQRLHQLWDYMIHGTGLLSSSAIVGVGTAKPHLGLILFGLGSADEKLLRYIANYKEETFRSLFPFSHDRTQEGFVLLASCLQPMSRGTITLNDTDPSSKPMIDPNYLQDTRDVACMVQAVQLAIRVATSESFKPLGAKVHLPNLEECRHLKADSENLPYLECIIRTAAITGYHPGGTCKMGNANDETTVVDPLLRVRGLEGLRVVDASLMPTPVSGHPNSILIAVAEKAADIILKQ